MRESDTYQMILGEGRQLEARQSLLLAGRSRPGEPGQRVRPAMEGQADLATLNRWLEQVAKIESWEDVSGMAGEEGQ